MGFGINRRERQLLLFAPDATDGIQDRGNRELKLTSLLSIGPLLEVDDTKVRALRELEEFYRLRQIGFHSASQTASLDEVMSALSEDEALIQYCIPHHPLHPATELIIVAVARNATEVSRVELNDLPGASDHTISSVSRVSMDDGPPTDQSPLGHLVWNLRISIQRADDEAANESLKILHRHLIEPSGSRFRAAEFPAMDCDPARDASLRTLCCAPECGRPTLD